jgi:imidazole glycerol-phosphate synthase subunit HisH
MSDPVVVIGSSGANLASLGFALERLGVDAPVTESVARIARAKRVILPGVGAAAAAMTKLRAAGLDRLIPTLEQPVLGICLGMQLLFEASDEGSAECLGIVPGRVERLPDRADLPVPHMGWNQLEDIRPTPLLHGIEAGSFAYFVHSYAVPISAVTLATANYGLRFSAAVAHRNFYGTQFHPERSSSVGAQILANFLTL